MTQEELGKKLFVTKQAVSKWENGKTLPDIETIRKLIIKQSCFVILRNVVTKNL